MKNIGLIFIFLSMLFFILSFFTLTNFPITGKIIESEDIEINLNKKEFFKYETIQVEIIGDIKEIISRGDVVIKRNDLIMPVNFYIEKISNNFYFAYATLNLEKGEYFLEIKVRTNTGIKIYKEKIKIKETNNVHYISLFNSIRDRIKYLNSRELIYSLQALKGIDENIQIEIVRELLKREKQLNDLEKALFLIFIDDNFPELKIVKSKILNYFLTIQDNNIGDYIINIKPNINLSCKIEDNKYNISKETNIPIYLNSTTNLNVSFHCFKIVDGNITNVTLNDLNLVNVYLIKEYFENRKIYNLNKRIENNTIIFDIEKEFGGINNDTKLTALFLIGLYKNNLDYNLTLEWLKKNKKGLIENIVLAIFNQTDSIHYLISNQNIDGSFNKDGNLSKAEVSCFAYNTEISTKYLIYNWVKENINNLNINDKAICLNFVLKQEDIIGVLPGVIKTETGKSFDIYIKNYGLKELNVSLINLLLDLNYTTTLKKDQSKKLTITTPSINYDKPYLQDKITILYGENSYIIPLIIFIKPSQTNETKINESESKEIIINQTKEVINETISFLNVFDINPDKISLTLNESTTIKIKIKNIINETIRDIIISYSASLYDVIKSIEPTIINSLLPNEEKNIEINFYLDKSVLSSYSGKINIEGKVKEHKYLQEIDVNVNISKISGLKSCYELNGTICKTNEVCQGSIITSKDGACCKGKCVSQKKDKKIWGIIFLILAIAFLVLAILLFLRKKPKEKKIEEVIKKIEEKQKLKYIKILF